MNQIDGSAMVCYRLTIATWKGNAMKFEYDGKETKEKPIAVLYKFNKTENRQCLAMRAQSGKIVWFYDNSLPSVQNNDFPDDDIIKEFYPGDKITITF